MAKTIIEVDLQIKGDDTVGKAEGKVKSLKTELKELKTLLASGTLDENQFSKLAARAGELQDKIGDVNQQVKNLASDGKALDGFVGLTEGIVGGFTAVQGITALVGDENEDLNKTLVKIQASMAVLNGLQAINNTLQKQSSAVLLLTNIQTKALAIGQQFLTATTLKSVAATYLLRAALIATGIGAIVVLIMSVVSAYSEWTESTNAQQKAQEALNEDLQTTKEYSEDLISIIDQTTKLQILKAKQLGANNETIRAIESEGRKKTIQELEAYYKETLKANEQWNVELYDNAEKAEEAKAKLDEAVREAAKKLNAARNADEIKREEDKLSAITEIKQANREYEEEQEKKRQKKLADIEKQADEDRRLRAKRDAFAKDELNRALELEKEEQELAEIRRKAEEDRLEKEKEANEKRLAEQKALNEAIILGEYSLQDAKLGIASQGVELIGALGQKNKALADAAFFLQKGIAIAEVVINTQREIAGIYANPTLTLLPDAGVTIKTSLAAAAKIRAGLSIATIAATAIGKGSANSSGGGGGGGAGQSSQPKPIQGFIPEGQATEGRPTGAQRVYVLEKDITDSQGRVARIRTNATLK